MIQLNCSELKTFFKHRSLKTLLSFTAASIFDGDYGSDLEDRLEAQLDALLDRKQRISVAKYKWTNSRVLLQYACNQLAFACKRWAELVNVPAKWVITDIGWNSLWCVELFVGNPYKLYFEAIAVI